MQKLIYRLPKRLARFICARRPSPIADNVVWMTSRFLQELKNENFDFHKNGERRLLEALACINPRYILDVGANVGHWSVMARQICPTASVHAFEILPTNWPRLEHNTASDDRIVIHHLGLSDAPGELRVFSSSKSELNDMATISKISEMQAHDDYYDTKTMCRVDTGAAFMNANKINRIDLLKIDTEGYDLNVLKGFGDKIHSITLVQFEYGVFNIGSRTLLADFFSFFSEHGFIVGKVYPRFIDFFDYDYSAEDFAGSNYVAVKKNDNKLIKAINGKIR